MPTLEKYIIKPVEAFKDISTLLNELNHNLFMIEMKESIDSNGEKFQTLS